MDQIEEVEDAAQVALSVVVLHDALVEFEAFFLLLVLVDEHGPPEVLVRVFEEPRFLLLLGLLVHLYLLALLDQQLFPVLRLLRLLLDRL